jgi:glycosyltransferase involved in cell wall biosynthesis/predicted  nucleic acid-binding Zn-ribbon protein
VYCRILLKLAAALRDMEADNSSGLGVNLIAYIRGEMGLGSAARGLATAMESADVPFNIINFEHANPGQHRDDSWRHKETVQSSYDFSILAINPDNLSNAITRAQKGAVRDRYTIGYWFWELPEIPDTWLESFALVDEVWAASRFVQDAISLKAPVPVFRVPVPVRFGTSNKFSRQDFALPQRQFLFLSLSDTHSELERKNPLGAIRAFKKAFPGDNKRAGLVVKISNVDSIHADHETMDRIREEAAGHRNIYLLDRNLPREQIEALVALCNCFVSLHRSEGFGLGPAEAMSLGKPAILTHWSGNIDYMRPQNSIAIDYELVRLGRQYGPYPPDQIWAEPDLEQAATWMKRLVTDRDLARRIGKLGQETIRKEFSPEVIGALIRERLSSLRAAGLSRRRTKVIRSDRVVAGPAVLSTSDGPATDAPLRVYFAGPSGYSEDLALEILYRTQRWTRVHVSMEQGLGAKPLRLDPMKAPGLIDIAGLAIKSARDGKVLWKVGAPGGLDRLEAGGSAVRIPHSRVARFLSYGDDPQIFLPKIIGPEFDGPLRLELWLKTNIRSVPADDPMLELARLSAHQTADLSEARVLLEQSRRDCSAREEQIEAYRSQLERADQELDSRKQELIETGLQAGVYQTELASTKKDLDQFAADLDLARSELVRLKKEISSQRSALRDATEETARIQSELATKCNELDAGGRELAATTHELTTVAGELAVLKRQLLDQQQVIDEIRAKRFWEDWNPLRGLAAYSSAKRALRQLDDPFLSSKELDSNSFWLEQPTGPSVAGDKIAVSGWVVSVSGEKIEKVEAVANGNKFTGLYGLERPDVAAARGGRSDFLHSGFVIDVTLPPGLHRISLRYLTSRTSGTTFCSFQHEVRQAKD